MMNGCHKRQFIDNIRCLPWFIRKSIFKYAGLRTQYLMHELTLPITQITWQLVMVDCLESNDTATAVRLLGSYQDYEPQWELLFTQTGEMLNAFKKSLKPTSRLSKALGLPDLMIQARPSLHLLLEESDRNEKLINTILNKLLAYITQHTMTSGLHNYYCRAVVECASAIGRLDIIQHYSDGITDYSFVGRLAALHGHEPIVKSLLAMGRDHPSGNRNQRLSGTDCEYAPPLEARSFVDIRCYEDIFKAAVEGGHVAMVDAMMRAHPPLLQKVTERLVTAALVRGHTRMVKHLLQLLSPQQPLLLLTDAFRNFLCQAAQCGHMDLVQYSLTHNQRLGRQEQQVIIEAIELAAIAGHFTIAESLCQAVNCSTVPILLGAAKGGHVDYIHHILATHCHSWTSNDVARALERATWSNHYHVVKLLVEHSLYSTSGPTIRQTTIQNLIKSSFDRRNFGLFSYLVPLLTDSFLCTVFGAKAIHLLPADFLTFFFEQNRNWNCILLSCLESNYSDMAVEIISRKLAVSTPLIGSAA
ncbi:hypothetical protein BATDEDRAFT_89326 [Batrachochytrium dendrobatidis JAM81]|uniref:Uncharacterized protein n=1 Tax=Batrachochytrium dendrobatidis (strain JAM81 / FGSC 10211) TaxID=684364 RepID=F4P4S1_BATDJ|nr:uncharacterized protein BATDEDRAFT_89326 [Batrachochytrium dendrobatidis JAM81]EGF79862.1 hypothetical protein BATDEDRAFT_89326 [Batrachochytrium dendrobatidis JAM81]|eukprot:XP_006679708.1 hypothetical protein BATDEDRAFT_89326 [Batrachochytrium dendrobatidis JAM81]